jgi:hypothetical protein
LIDVYYTFVVDNAAADVEDVLFGKSAMSRKVWYVTDESRRNQRNAEYARHQKSHHITHQATKFLMVAHHV